MWQIYLLYADTCQRRGIKPKDYPTWERDHFDKIRRIEREAARDVQDAEIALADFDKNGGTSLAQLKQELGLSDDGQQK